MVVVEEDSVRRIGAVLNDPTKPLKARFRALFSLKNLGGPLSIAAISECFSDSSALLKHELAYCLGQMQDETAMTQLIKVLEDRDQEPIVRHEAAEALGAIGSDASTDILKKYTSDEIREVAETCQLAIQRLDWLKNKGREKIPDSVNPYNSVDPAPPSEETNIDSLKRMLMDENLSLFDRYRVMFSLRNLTNDESALALTKGLKTDSALFSHEIAFVLGQLQNQLTIPALIDCLSDESQNEMVRHECAEALGAIATEECFEVLKKHLIDSKRVVRESCEVALDMCDYENSSDFQYALM